MHKQQCWKKYARDTAWPLSYLPDFRKTPMINKVKREMRYAGIGECAQGVEEIFVSGVAVGVTVFVQSQMTVPEGLWEIMGRGRAKRCCS